MRPRRLSDAVVRPLNFAFRSLDHAREGSIGTVVFFGRLSTEGQARFLARLGWELTLFGRHSYGEGLTEPSLMRTINELQHRLLSHLRDLLENEPARLPDDVLTDGLLLLIEGLLLDHPDESIRVGVLAAYDRAAKELTETRNLRWSHLHPHRTPSAAAALSRLGPRSD